ncbi:hypothetical protein DUZ99_04355 [Xylanibacillus composti]|nr:hypothetical protein [Xylanibacillus composti]
MNKIPGELLEERLETVKTLETSELEQYSIEKDRLTGEHYLLYAYVHRDAAPGMQEEVFHHLLPLESDDVLALVLGEQPYTYPDHWHRSFLRDGPDGCLVWFSPAGPASDEDQEFQRELLEGLAELKQKGGSEEDIRKLLDRLHRKQGD